jgi:hypothetical protein
MVSTHDWSNSASSDDKVSSEVRFNPHCRESKGPQGRATKGSDVSCSHSGSQSYTRWRTMQIQRSRLSASNSKARTIRARTQEAVARAIGLARLRLRVRQRVCGKDQTGPAEGTSAS